MKKLVFLNLFLSFIFTALCQYPGIHFDRISDENGLYDLWIKCILQDRRGFIWIGGENGLYRYDGFNIINHKEPPYCNNCPHFYPVYDLVEDSLGMLWTISYNGIIVYDPENERSWAALRFGSAGAISGRSFMYNRKLDINVDSDGNIWATGENGLIRFSYKKDVSLKDIKSGEDPGNFLETEFIKLSPGKNPNKNSVIKIYTDSEGNIWAGCEDGLYVLRMGDSGFHRFEIKTEIKALSRTYVSDMIEQNKDTFWILSGSADYMITNVKKALSGSFPDDTALHFFNLELNLNHVHSLLLSSGQPLFKDRDNHIILGINGFHRFRGIDENGSPEFESTYTLKPDIVNFLSDIERIFEDRSGMIWLAHQRKGITNFNPDRSRFLSYYNSGRYKLTVLDFDSEGNIWMGGFNTGLFTIQKETGILTQFDLGKNGNQIVSMKEISPGIFWIGTSKTGIVEFNTLTGKYHNPFPEGRVAENLSRTQVNDMLREKNHIYCATLNGIFVCDLLNNTLVQFTYPEDSSCYQANWAISPLKLQTGDIIVFTSLHGINRINYHAETGSLSLTCLMEDSVLRKNNINMTHICRLYQDSQGSIWMVEKSGLHKINLEKGEIVNFKLFKNIDFPDAWSILEDKQGDLWIGTHFGLCRFNIKTGQVKEFTMEDGVPISVHEYNAAIKDKDGILYFGGDIGFYSFNPDSIKSNTYIPPVVITDFRLFNKSVLVDTSKNSILTKNIAYTSQVELRHNQNDLSFEFAALDYTRPARNQFAYKLEGYQDKWIETDANNRVATYTNLDPGKYAFRVKGSNSDGVWNEAGTSLTIIIKEPWWGTNLAWAGYALIFIFSIGGYIRWRVYRLKREKIYLENQVHERTLQIEEQKEKILSQRDILEQQNILISEHEQLKSRFFTNVSHEFRTPLSLIQSPVEEMLDDPHCTEKERRKLNMVYRNARRLLNLVNQLLDISKIDGSKMKLELVQDDIMKFIRALAGSFCSLAESKRIHFIMHFSTEAKKTMFDPDKLEKIATNLLSNAFRFTPEDGEIILTAGYKECHDPLIKYCLEFTVKDNGPGIPDGSLEKIFDRFYQVEESMKKEGGGTGIGLSLSREMARLMYGDIMVASKPGEGCTFTVTLPLGKEHLKESEFILLEKAPETEGFIFALRDIPDEVIPDRKVKVKDGKPVILIVEDNLDIRIQLSDNLNHQYFILEAIDGLAGLKQAIMIIPDLIITDLMMPSMDGIEMCEKLKNDERTSHIPIIMLTARAALEDKIAGYQTGADDYMPKPFQMAELKVRVANLIAQRRKLRERFSREVTLQPHDISITPPDEKFLNRAIEIVEKHMNDESFGIPEFREEMIMTRSTLNRKLRALTNQSPGDFIRIIRLKRAANLLRQNFGNVTQVSYEVGFNNLTSFNRSFRKLFGVTPSEYKKQIS